MREDNMEKLIEALQIFLKYKNEEWPTNCSHDVLAIMGVGENDVTDEDMKRLVKLDFIWNDEYDSFISFKYGSA
jgi:hypothetical protein